MVPQRSIFAFRGTVCTPLFAAVALLISPSVLFSADRDWLAVGGGNFGTSSHWSDDSVPLAADTAIFGLDETYTVTIDGDYTNLSARIANGNVSFTLAPDRTYTITDTFTIGSVASQSPTLTISGGADSSLAVAGWTVGSGDPAQAVTTTITGPNTLVEISGVFLSDPRPGGHLFVTRIENGATLKATGATFRIEYNSNVTVSGAGSRLEYTGSNTFESQSGNSVFRVEDGGYISTLQARLASRTSNTTAIVTGAGSEWSNTRVHIGERANENKNATVLVLDGGLMSTSGAVWTHTDSAGDSHRLVVSGAGSHWTAADFYVAGRGGTFARADTSLAVVDGATVTATNSMRVYPKGIVSGDGGITVTAATLGLDNFGGTVTPGVYAFSHSWNNDAGGTDSFSFADAIGTLTVTGNYRQVNAVIDSVTHIPTLVIRVAGFGDADQLNVLGDINLTGILQVNPFGSPVLSPYDTFTILNWTGDLTGSFTTIDAFDPGGGLSWNFDNLYIDGTISVIPEPAAVSLLIAAIAALVVCRRKAS